MSLTENLLYLYSICALPLFLWLDRKRDGDPPRALDWRVGTHLGQHHSARRHPDSLLYGFVALIWTAMRRKGSSDYSAIWLLSLRLTMLVAAIQLAPSWVSYQHSDQDRSCLIPCGSHPLVHPSPRDCLTLLVSPIGDSAHGDRIAQALFHTQEQGRGPAGFWAESLYLGLPVSDSRWRGCDAARCSSLWCSLWPASSSPWALMAASTTCSLIGCRYGRRFAIRKNSWASRRLASLCSRQAAWTSCAAVVSAPTHGIWQQALFAALAGVLATQQGPRVFSEVFLVPSDLAQHIAHSMGLSAVCGGAAALGMGMIVRWMKIRPADRFWAGAAIVLLIILDLARANLPMVQTSSSEAWTFTPGLVSALAGDAKVKGPGHFRILSMKDQYGGSCRRGGESG